MGGERLEIRSDILEKVTSEEAVAVTPHLCRIYMRLVNAPTQYWERENVLRFNGSVEGGREAATAWEQLAQFAMVSPGMAREALAWLNDQKVITLTTSREGREIVLSFEGVSHSGKLR